MGTLKTFITILTTTVIFISAIEILSPDNKMKQYVSFVLGLILITTMINPIVSFMTKGEASLLGVIEECQNLFSTEKDNETAEEDTSVMSYESGRDNEDSREKAFKKNFNQNCDSMLKNQFKNMNFKTEVECSVDFNEVKININKVRIGVSDKDSKKVKKVKKVQINDQTEDKASNENEDNEKYKEIKTYVAEEIQIPANKIEIYELDD